MARILVIDDDPTFRCLVTAVLESRGYAVVVAGDGRAGVNAFAQGNVDLVVTDIVMPEQEGIATIGAIRRLSTVPILAVSGSNTVGRYGDYLHMAEELGANAALKKPLNPDCLVETIDRLLKA